MGREDFNFSLRFEHEGIFLAELGYGGIFWPSLNVEGIYLAELGYGRYTFLAELGYKGYIFYLSFGMCSGRKILCFFCGELIYWRD